jgi:hypothetical protein
MDTVGDTYHQAGGTVMAETAETGVVDKNLKVFGTENLYIGGAGTFPSTSNANVTFTAIILAEGWVNFIANSPPSLSRVEPTQQFPNPSPCHRMHPIARDLGKRLEHERAGRPPRMRQRQFVRLHDQVVV